MKTSGAWVGTAFFLFAAARATAHYHILLSDPASAVRETSVKFTLRFGHPFEHQMFSTAKPKSVTILKPDGQTVDVSGQLARYDVTGS